MKNHPVVSVIMNVYNSQKYLEAAIKSIISQTYKNFEFIIIDDGSTDDSYKIINKWAKKDTRIIAKKQKNIGIPRTLNKAIKYAKGKYIARMDSDDISLPKRLQKEVKYLDNHPDISLVSSYIKIIDENDKIIGNFTPATADKEIKKTSIFSCQFNHSASMYRKKDFLEIDGYNPKFRYAQDFELWFRFMENYNVANIPEYLVLWRKTSEQVSTNKKNEQEKYATLAKKEAIKRGQYPLYSIIFLIWPYIWYLFPPKLRKKVKKIYGK